MLCFVSSAVGDCDVDHLVIPQVTPEARIVSRLPCIPLANAMTGGVCSGDTTCHVVLVSQTKDGVYENVPLSGFSLSDIQARLEGGTVRLMVLFCLRCL
jgi:hypothetical protein